MSWTRIPHPTAHACCPWPQHCACARTAPRPAPAPRPALRPAPGPQPTPVARVAPAHSRLPTDLGASGDSWERVLRRLAAEDAARRARQRNPWFSDEGAAGPRAGALRRRPE